MAFPLNVIIASATRTPVGRAKKGSLRHTRPDDLAAQAMAEAVRRVDSLEAKDIEDVILGNATPEGEQGLLMGRLVALRAGLPKEVGGATINRWCGSSMSAIHTPFPATGPGSCCVGVPPLCPHCACAL